MQVTEGTVQQEGAQGTAPTEGYSDTASLQTELFMQAREMRLMLIIGLANGAVIGGFFLIYLVVAVISGEQVSFAPNH